MLFSTLDDGPHLRSYLEKQQKIAVTKKKNRVEHMGELLRSKGFVWVASSNKIMGGWQQAGNVIRMEGEGLWMCENPALWKGTGTEELVLKDMRKESGEDWPFGDRRQELVFIGIKLSIDAIQNTLDGVSYFYLPFCYILDMGFRLKVRKSQK